MRPTDIQEVDVYKSDVLVGTIERTKRGAIFRYKDTFVSQSPKQTGVAFQIPPSRRSVPVAGTNLPPYFAGLLPEGLRFSALHRRLKTSADDLLSMLIAVGRNCVGDTSVMPSGVKPGDEQIASDLKTPEQSDFDNLLRTSIDPHADFQDPGTLPGVQEKVSGSMISIPIRGRAEKKDYILKLNPPDHPRLVENEEFFLRMARACGLVVNDAKLVYDKHGRSGLLVTRFDRITDKESGETSKIHVEDSCQFLDRYPAAKYEITCQEVVDGIMEFAVAPFVQILRFLELCAFSYIIGNGDLHAKNVSLWESPKSGSIELSPFYDLLSTQAYKGMDQRMAMKLGAKDDEWRARDFVMFGERNGIPEIATRKMLGNLCRKAAPWSGNVHEIGLQAKARLRIERCIEERCKRLSP